MFKSLKLTPQTICRILATSPHREDNDHQNYDEKDLHKNDSTELYSGVANIRAGACFL